MKFKELKKSSMFQSSDFDDMEVMICVARNGKRQYEPLSFLGWAPLDEYSFMVLGGLTEVQRKVELGEMPAPQGYLSPSQVNPIVDENSEDPSQKENDGN
jgi:hypothetical protein